MKAFVKRPKKLNQLSIMGRLSFLLSSASQYSFFGKLMYFSGILFIISGTDRNIKELIRYIVIVIPIFHSLDVQLLGCPPRSKINGYLVRESGKIITCKIIPTIKLIISSKRIGLITFEKFGLCLKFISYNFYFRNVPFIYIF